MFDKFLSVKRWLRLGAAMVVVFSAGVFSEETDEARVPVKVNVNATVTIAPSGDVGTGQKLNVQANTETVFTLLLNTGNGGVSVSHRARRQNAGVSFGRIPGGVSLKLHARQYKDADISLYSVNGRRVLRGKASAANGSFGISRANIAKGVYLLSVKGADGSAFSTRMTHSGGKLNISVSFDGGEVSLNKQAAAADYGVWTITAAASGYTAKSQTFSPVKGDNMLQTITLEESAGPSCTERPADTNLDKSRPDLGITENAIVVTYSGDEAEVEYRGNNIEGAMSNVTVSGAHVYLQSNITNEQFQPAVILNGSTNNGSFSMLFNVRTDLYLNGVSIKNPDGAAINIRSGKRTSVNLVGGCDRRNYLEDGEVYIGYTANSMPKGAFFSEGTLEFDGGGYLEVRSNYNHAIVSDEHLRIDNADIVIINSKNDGIHVNNDIEISGGKVYVNSVGDAIQSEKDVNNAGIVNTIGVTVTGGEITLNTTGLKSHGIASETDVHISGESSKININVAGPASKGIRARGKVTIAGGEVEANTFGGVHTAQPGDPNYDASDTESSSSGVKTPTFEMTGGKYTSRNTGNNSKGMSIDNNAAISGGEVYVEAVGDGIKVDGELRISGNANVYSKSSTKKGIDCDKYTRAPTATVVTEP